MENAQEIKQPMSIRLYRRTLTNDGPVYNELLTPSGQYFRIQTREKPVYALQEIVDHCDTWSQWFGGHADYWFTMTISGVTSDYIPVFEKPESAYNPFSRLISAIDFGAVTDEQHIAYYKELAKSGKAF